MCRRQAPGVCPSQGSADGQPALPSRHGIRAGGLRRERLMSHAQRPGEPDVQPGCAQLQACKCLDATCPEYSRALPSTPAQHLPRRLLQTLPTSRGRSKEQNRRWERSWGVPQQLPPPAEAISANLNSMSSLPAPALAQGQPATEPPEWLGSAHTPGSKLSSDSNRRRIG